MSSQRTERILGEIRQANEETTKETERITALMTEQCREVVKISGELAELLAVEAEALPGEQCHAHAERIKGKRQELMDAVNRLASPPYATKAWVQTFNHSIYGLESPYIERFNEWWQEVQAEEARQERARAYKEQCEREQELHERRLRGELV